MATKRQQQELKERIQGLELLRTRDQKELERSHARDKTHEGSTHVLSQQISELQRSQRNAESTIRQLRLELQASQKELDKAHAREGSKFEAEDVKVRGFLERIRKLDAELIAAKGTNAFLKKQLDTSNLTLQVARQDSARQVELLETKLHNAQLHRGVSSGTTENKKTNLVNNRYSSPPRARSSSTRYYAEGSTSPEEIQANHREYQAMAQDLDQQQQQTELLRQQVRTLESERQALVTGWQHMRGRDEED